MRIRIEPWEVNIIRMIDRLAILEATRKRPQNTTDDRGRAFENKGTLDDAPALSAFKGARVLKP